MLQDLVLPENLAAENLVAGNLTEKVLRKENPAKVLRKAEPHKLK